MSASKVVEWALIVDIGILIMLSIDVYFTYQTYKMRVEEKYGR